MRKMFRTLIFGISALMLQLNEGGSMTRLPLYANVNVFQTVGCNLKRVEFTTRDYVQDGLIAMWDGIENEGCGIHTRSPNMWKDIVSGRTIDTSSASWTADSVVFDVYASCQVDFSFMNDAVAFEVVVSIHQFDGVNTGLSLLESSYSLYNSATTKSLWIGLNHASPQLSQYDSQNVCCSYSDREFDQRFGLYRTFLTGIGYMNDQNVSWCSGTYCIASKVNTVGSRKFSAKPEGWFNGNLFALRFYSHYSEHVHANNYLIDKARFNI